MKGEGHASFGRGARCVGIERGDERKGIGRGTEVDLRHVVDAAGRKAFEDGFFGAPEEGGGVFWRESLGSGVGW